MEYLATAPWLAFGLFLLVGFLAQIIDGALGMAYGAISSTLLMSLGVPPAAASAAIHAAECVTTGASGASHLAHRNVDLAMLARLAPAGVAGGVLGAYILTGLDQVLLKAVIALYLMGLGVVILVKALRTLRKVVPAKTRHLIPLGLTGGFLDASGGGGWGPIVTSTLIGSGQEPRRVVGTVNTCEFFVTVAITTTFIITILTGRLDLGEGAFLLGVAVGGLITGGVIAAPLAGYVTKIAPARLLMGAVGLLVMGLAGLQASQAWPELLQRPAVTAFLHSHAP